MISNFEVLQKIIYPRLNNCSVIRKSKQIGIFGKYGHDKHTNMSTVEPRYKEVGYNKPSYNKVSLLVPTLYISWFFYPDIMRNLI